MGGVDIGRRRAATPPWPGLLPVRAGLVIDFCTSPMRTGNSTYYYYRLHGSTKHRKGPQRTPETLQKDRKGPQRSSETPQRTPETSQKDRKGVPKHLKGPQRTTKDCKGAPKLRKGLAFTSSSSWYYRNSAIHRRLFETGVY